VDRLVLIIRSRTAAHVRAAALRALEGIDDRRALAAALIAINDSDRTVAVAAIALARRFLRGPGGADAVDRLVTATTDRARPDDVRVAALRALRDLDRRTIAPLLKSLASDPIAAVRTEAGAEPGRRRLQPTKAVEVLVKAADRGLPADAGQLRRAVISAGGEVTLTVLLRIIERVRERENGLAPVQRARWSAVRATAHVALANRDSRLGLYDLRESLEALHEKLPVELLSALMLVGDASCLPVMASAHARSDDTWFRERLADVFRVVVKRERLTRRHAVMKKIQQRWPETLEQLQGR
jgi:HEAT repeat protein